MGRKLMYIFICSIIALLGGVTVMSIKDKKEDPSILRVAFPYAKPASAYEPARIHLAPEYIFLENIYSPLVELSASNGVVGPGVAESYRWSGNELHLVIRGNLKTISGQPITAADAEFSLKRLMTLPGNTHGDFRKLICGNMQLKSVEESCDGIRTEGNELILKTTTAGKTFLLPMLASIDFAVILKSAVDPKTLKIIDFQNTSGPYYVAQDSENGEIQLKANPHHFHYTATMPQTVQLVPTDSQNPNGSLDDFTNDRVDFITTIDSARADDVIAYSRTRSDATLHATMNIRSFLLAFSERGRRELTKDERFAIGKKIRESMVKKMAGIDGYEKSTQFFPAFGEGAIEEDKMNRIDESFESPKLVPNKTLKLTLLRLGDTSKFIEAAKEAIPQVEVSEAKNSPDFTEYASPDDMPQMFIAGPDTGFLEDIGLISYSLNTGYFGLSKDERGAWLKRYMETLEKSRRLELLKELHEASLREPIIVPLLVAPYAALARKPWKIGLSQLHANNQLWLVQTN